jgi:hypothetical protein
VAEAAEAGAPLQGPMSRLAKDLHQTLVGSPCRDLGHQSDAQRMCHVAVDAVVALLLQVRVRARVRGCALSCCFCTCDDAAAARFDCSGRLARLCWHPWCRPTPSLPRSLPLTLALIRLSTLNQAHACACGRLHSLSDVIVDVLDLCFPCACVHAA